jgi:hypothetical protein
MPPDPNVVADPNAQVVDPNAQVADPSKVVDPNAQVVDPGKVVDPNAKVEPPKGAPEAYADFTLPKGVAFDDKSKGAFSTLAKKHNLTQEAAQEFADFGAQITTQNLAALTEASQKTRNDWAAAAQVDKEFGGEKLEENRATAKEALKQFGTPELTQFLDASGLGNNPELIRWAFRVGKALKEDTLSRGAPAAKERLPGEGWYDHPTSQPKT